MHSHGRRTLAYVSRLALAAALLFAACETRRTVMAPERPTVQPQFATAGTAELFFSEYIEGSSNNKALEIYNGTGSAISLDGGGYKVLVYFNGAPAAGLTIELSGTAAAGDVFVIAPSSANATILAQADQMNSMDWFNGDDAVALVKGATVIDVIGQIGFDPGTEWGTGLASTADNTLRRRSDTCVGAANGSDAFDPALQWDGYATDSFDGLGAHSESCPDAAPAVSSTTPADGAVEVALDANVTVTFSEPVNLAGSAFEITCGTSGTHTLAVSGGPVTFTLDPDGDFAAEACTVTVNAAAVTDQDDDDPPDVMEANHGFTFYTVGVPVCELPFTAIPSIQGSGSTAALPGVRSTRGVVVGDYEGSGPTLRGFFIQDAAGDADPATSDGIFVFNGANNSVSLGDLVHVTGMVREWNGQTEFTTVTEITNCGTGSIPPTDVLFPVASTTYLERYEGMLVRLPQTMYVTEHFQLGRFGQVALSSGGRLRQPTAVAAPGAPALAVQAQNDLNRVILDDALQDQNPDPILFGRGGSPLSASNTLRGGDAATNIVGVMTFTWSGNSVSGNAWRVRPINALGGYVEFEPANPRPSSTPAVGGTLRVAGMNLLNYYNTFSGCTNGVGGAFEDCRGAEDAAEFARQAAKLVPAIVALAPDVLGVTELENDGYGPSSAIADLVDRLNATADPGTFAFIDVDAATGLVNALGTDGIRVGLIYRTAAVAPVGTTAVLDSEAFVNGGDPLPQNRPSLAQAFEQPNHARVVVVVNHLRSKGSGCTSSPDLGDGQGACNNVRTNAVIELKSWLTTDPTGTLVQDVLLLGDFNAYAQEYPIANLVAYQAYENLIDRFLGVDAYSYVFDGQWGYTDYAFASAPLASQVSGAGFYHVNADEPSVLDYNTNFKSAGQIISLYAADEFRTSDHDPVLVGLDLGTMEFGGVLAPLSLASYNTATAGSSIPVKFTLNGYHGTGIFDAGYPEVKSITCPDELTLAVAPMGGGGGKAPPQLLTYDPDTDTYAYLWRTDKRWVGTCQRMTLRFTNGAEYSLAFSFTR